ncbi:Vacuolar morphogenesis protein 6 [Tieghemiomyces parasiticus]|uniref:Vacuolar morphogenesis protein 6 n=1 Tax=Tieghemiomyces parasiticus TaxID=78921 RepID=A0A9W8A4H5_9FUNG|nr:Vacuolar morphogenesis protein 6 [Tieghemiomyces parasiticus]
MHDAFAVLPVAEQLPLRATASLAYSDRLLVGSDSGVLLVYAVKESAAAVSAQPPSDTLSPLVLDQPPSPSGATDVEPVDYTALFQDQVTLELIDCKKGFTRRAIEQLDLVKEAGLLVVLADGLVTLYDLGTFALNTQLPNTKGATGMTVHTGVEMVDGGGIPTLVSRVAVAVRRRLLVFTWKDAEFAGVQQFTVPDRVRTLAWATATQLCLGLGRAEYHLLPLATGTLTELLGPDTVGFATSSGASVFSSATGAGAGRNNLSKWGSMGFGVLSSMTLGASGTDDPDRPVAGSDALVAKLPNDEILVNRDRQTLRVGLHPTPSQKSDMVWTVGPLILGYAYPYVIALSGRHVEVRNLDTTALVQQLDLPAPAERITGGKALYLLGAHTVWRLIALPYQVQVAQLLARHEYVEALSFVDQSEGILVDVKAAYVPAIKLLYAYYLFWSHDFETALSLFQDLEVAPADVVHLFTRGLDEYLQGPTPPASPRPPPSRPEADTQDPPPVDAEGSHGDPKDDDDGDADTAAAATAQLRDRTALLVGYLTEQRRLISQAISRKQTQLTFATRQPVPGDGLSPLDAILHRRLPFQLGPVAVPLAPLAALVDTALLKAYLLTNPSLVGPLVRVHNNACEVEIGESLLLRHRRYQELVDLYYGKALHRKALQLLHALATRTEREAGTDPRHPVPPALAGPTATVGYLAKLPLQHLDLLFEYAGWVMQRDPTVGITVFADDNRPPADYLRSPVDRVAQFLERFGVAWSMRYLEFVRSYVLVPLSAQQAAEKLAPTESDEADSGATETGRRRRHIDVGHSTGNFPALLQFSSSPDNSGDASHVSDSNSIVAPQVLDRVFRTVDQRLALLYLDAVTQTTDSEGAEVSSDSPARTRLQAFLRTSTYYTPESILSRLPDDALHQERALVLAHMGRHEQALQIIIYQLADHTQAEVYCHDRQADVADIYLTLLRIYLRPESKALGDPTDSPYLTQALDLMTRYGRHLDPLVALPLVPASLPLQKLYPFFEESLRASHHRQQTRRVVRNLMVAERIQVQAEWSQLRARRVVITSDRVCPLCLKRIGSTVFVLDPRDQPAVSDLPKDDIAPAWFRPAGLTSEPVVVHYSCHQRRQR